MTRAYRMVQRNAMVFRRIWPGSIFMTFLQPTLYLAAMGLGVGVLVDRGSAVFPGKVSYLAFLAPGLLAATCMQTASFESSFPISGKMLWERNYEAIFSAPMRVVDIVVGELAWVALRLLASAVVFTGVMWLFGAARTPLVLAAIPAAVLTGLAFSAPIIAFSGAMKKGGNFNALFRFVITPLFLFGGAFYPIEQLPEWLQTIAKLTPIWNGVELCRDSVNGELEWDTAIVHVAYLLLFAVVGWLFAARTFAKRLGN